MPQPKAPKKGQQMKSREEQLEEVITDFKTKGSKIAEEIITGWMRGVIHFFSSALSSCNAFCSAGFHFNIGT
jgi:hypothetical protein